MRVFYWAKLIAALAGCWGVSAQTVLTITVDKYVPYFDDVSDPRAFGSNPDLTPGTNGEFMRFVFIGDIVAVNDQPARGTWTATSTVLFLSPNPTPTQAAADVERQNIIEMYFDLLQADGTAVGTLMATGLTRGRAAPGAPKIQTEDSMAIVGGTGAFLGARGQVGIIDRGSPRAASMRETPANRRINGGARRSYVLHLIPMAAPEVVMTSSGPAVFHADFSAVSASKPAKAGEVLVVKARGLGPTRPGIDPGQPFPLDATEEVNSPLDVIVNGHSAEVINRIGWPGLVDAYRVDFRLPDSITAGTATIQLTAAWTSGPAVSIAVQ